jgi:HlyD family secretion protein
MESSTRSAGAGFVCAAFAAFACLTAIVTAAGCARPPQPDAYGNVEATEVVVGAEAGGRLLSLSVTEGQKLDAGAAVGAIDAAQTTLERDQLSAQRAATASRVDEVGHQTDVLRAQRSAATAQRDAAKAQRDGLAAQREIAQRTHERTERLFAQQAATAQQLDAAERDLHTLEAQIEATGAQRQTAGREVVSSDARVAQIRDQIRKSRVLNPVAGTVLTTYATAGEFVQIGQPLYKIANLDTMELRAYVTEPQLAHIKVGQPVQVSIDVGGEARRAITGTISWVSSQAEFTPTPIETRDERANLVYAIKVRVPNAGGMLKIGMPADVQFATVTASR